MAEGIEHLIRVQAEIKQRRRWAVGIFDPETAARLRKLADELERRAREADADSWLMELNNSAATLTSYRRDVLPAAYWPNWATRRFKTGH